MRESKLYSSIIPAILMVFIIMLSFGSSVEKERQEERFPRVIQPCSSSISSESKATFQTCKGEYRYCGNGNYKCIQFDDGLFACCDEPEKCPEP